MANTNQLNIRIRPEHRQKLERLAAGEGVTVGGAIALLLDNTPMQPVYRTMPALTLAKNNRHDAQVSTGQSVTAVERV